MSGPQTDIATLPDLIEGVPASLVTTGESVVGRVGDEAVLVVRTKGGLRAVQATCPHYGAPLADGCVHDGRIQCPWHHASFDLSDGTVCRPPALDPLRTWRVEERDGRIRVPAPSPRLRRRNVSRRMRGTIAIVGAGAAGTAAALTLREGGHPGPILLIDPDPDAPYDRPNLSKDYLAGAAPEEWLPLRSDEEWRALGVERMVDRVATIGADERVLELGGGRRVAFDGAILATGAAPRRLHVPGEDQDLVFTLRSLKDCRAIRDRARAGARAVLVGAGFIGLEAAASLRRRSVDVDVINPDPVPLGRVLGPELGSQIRTLHEQNGVRFHDTEVREIESDRVLLKDGTELTADLVLIGIGVAPRLTLAVEAGLEVDDGVVVDPFLETARKGIYAAGDIAAFPDPRTGRRLRMEHWAVAEAQGRTAAFNLLGYERPFRHVPFFWTSQYDLTLQWSGFPGSWDRIHVEGSVEEGSLAARFEREGRTLAAAFVGRDRESLKWGMTLEDELTGVGS